jgi:hypothetical protein
MIPTRMTERELEPPLPGEVAAENEHRFFRGGHAGIAEEHDHENGRVAKMLKEMAGIEHAGG